MPELMLKVPTTWSALHSVAYMLLCVSIADGDLDERELVAVQRMVAQHGRVSSGEATAATGQAYGWLRHVIDQRGRDGYMASLRGHATRLANHYGPSALRAVIDDMLAVAAADGVLDDAEVALIHAVGADWEVTEEV